jgi:hypothetical protein
MQQIEPALRADGQGQTAALASATNAGQTLDASDIMDGGAEQPIRARFRVIVQDEDMHVVTTREALDKPEQARRDALPAGSIEAAGDNESDAHPQ